MQFHLSMYVTCLAFLTLL